MFHNVVVGKPIVNVSSLLALDERDWEENEKNVLVTAALFIVGYFTECWSG